MRENNGLRQAVKRVKLTNIAPNLSAEAKRASDRQTTVFSTMNKRFKGTERSASIPQRKGKTNSVADEAERIWLIRLKSRPRSRSTRVIKGMIAPPTANCSAMAAHSERGRGSL